MTRTITDEYTRTFPAGTLLKIHELVRGTIGLFDHNDTVLSNKCASWQRPRLLVVLDEVNHYLRVPVLFEGRKLWAPAQCVQVFDG